jgi:hypothetical protein
VKAVVNEIEVRLPSSAERTDAEIAAVVVRALESGRPHAGRGFRDRIPPAASWSSSA